MRISVWQLISKVFLIAAFVAFAAFHFVPDPEQNNDAGWNVWLELWDLAQYPSNRGIDPLGWVAVASFLAASLLIVASPFLGKVWIKSMIAWLPTVIFSGISAAGLFVAFSIGRDPESIVLSWILVVAAPVLNFIGLLFARVGVPKIDASPWIPAVPPALPEVG